MLANYIYDISIKRMSQLYIYCVAGLDGHLDLSTHTSSYLFESGKIGCLKYFKILMAGSVC